MIQIGCTGNSPGSGLALPDILIRSEYPFLPAHEVGHGPMLRCALRPAIMSLIVAD